MKMSGYLGGDRNTLVTRRAHENDLRVAVEFEDHNRMLTFVVMQTGEVMLAFSNITSIEDEENFNEMTHVGTVHTSDSHDELYFVRAEEVAPVEYHGAPLLHIVESDDEP